MDSFAAVEDESVLRMPLLLASLVVAFLPAPCAAQSAKTSKVDYDRDIRPILSGKCYACHGQDQPKDPQEQRVRLDLREEAIKRGAIAPGRPDESELIRRIHHKLDRKRMPPPKSNKTLTAHEKELLERWIAEGAAYSQHWAFIKPVRPAIP